MTGNNVLLQRRDYRLLHELATMRLIDRELAKLAAGFNSTTRANTRLLKLVRAGLLNRFFVGTVGAGRKAVYALSRKGTALVASPHRPVSRRFGRSLVGDLFVDHQMRINEIYAALKFRALPAGVRFVVWRAFSKPISPGCGLIPDSYFELQTPPGIRAHFLEVDLGTETRPVWEKKIRAYLQIAISGDFLRTFGQPQFRVLVLAASEKRLASIRGVIAKHTDKIFYLSTFESINSGGFCSSVWLRPKGDQRQSLV